MANAVKYGGRDRWVGIRAEHVRDHGAGEVRITVSDHGNGIPAAELPHIFEPFYRGGTQSRNRFTATGSACRSSRRIVDAHGGR